MPAKTKTTKRSTTTTKPKAVKPKATKPKAAKSKTAVTFSSGGNPKIPNGEGVQPVSAYIAAMPGWKRAVGRKLDALIVRSVPRLRKAVRASSPFYGTEKHGWFLGVHCYPKLVRLTFFNGAQLNPQPPGPSKVKGVRYLDLYEGDSVETPQLAKWIKAAAAKPGWDGESDLC